MALKAQPHTYTHVILTGLSNPTLCRDMPFGSYESGATEALRNAYRFIKEAGCDAVKVHTRTHFVSNPLSPTMTRSKAARRGRIPCVN